MQIITAQQVEALQIAPETCIQWVTDSFRMKYQSQCPAKPSVHPKASDFISTMPALLPSEYHTFGVKVVSRVNGRHPALRSEIMLYDTETGDARALVNGDWITAMRTGAVAALAMQTFRRPGANRIAMVGLGSTARTAMTCIARLFAQETLHVTLRAYKDQAERFAQDFSHLPNVRFTIARTDAEFMDGAQVVISCITDADGLLVPDDRLFGEGILVIPVHTRGFQNCDLFFDKVFGDDTDHIRGFKYFDRFRRFDELSRVLLGQTPGRESATERILAYNIGLGLHDVLFAHRITQML